MLVGYARVSTDAQSLEAQMAALKAAGCERLYAEKRSGAETDRKALAKLMKEASPGDTVVVTRLDRLARSTRDLLVRLGKDNIGFKSLREASVDTTSPQGRLVVNILASISEFERELIHARMTEGRNRAVANGVKFGASPSEATYPYRAERGSVRRRPKNSRSAKVPLLLTVLGSANGYLPAALP